MPNMLYSTPHLNILCIFLKVVLLFFWPEWGKPFFCSFIFSRIVLKNTQNKDGEITEFIPLKNMFHIKTQKGLTLL